MISVKDKKLRSDFKKLKGTDSTVAKYQEAGRLWDNDNAPNGAYDIKTVVTKEIHAMGNHHSKIIQDNNDKFIKSCRNCGKGHKVKQCPAKDKPCNKCNKMGHFANKCRSSQSDFQGSWVEKLQRKPFTKLHQGSKPALSRNEPIHLMTADSCVGVSDSGTIDDNFDNVQWMTSIDVSYNLAISQTTYEATLHTTTIHNIQQRQKSQACKIVGMLTEDTESKLISPAIDIKCKIDTDTATNVFPISTSGKLCQAMFDGNGNALDEFNKDWTTLRAYGGGLIKQFGTRMIKCKLKYQKWVFLFHIVDAEGPTLLGLMTLRHIGIFSKHPRVYIETIDLHSMNLALASEQTKVGEDGQYLSTKIPKYCFWGA